MSFSVNNTSQNFQASQSSVVQKLEPGHYVLKPPENFYRYSLYDELNLDRDIYKEFLQKQDTKYLKKSAKLPQKKQNWKKTFKIATVIGACLLAYNLRNTILNTTTRLISTVKNFVK